LLGRNISSCLPGLKSNPSTRSSPSSIRVVQIDTSSIDPTFECNSVSVASRVK